MYPTDEQEKQMLSWIETCRRLWNDALSHRQSRWKELKQSTTYNQQSNILTEARKDNQYLSELYSQVGQAVLRRLDRSYKAFFKHVAKPPKFKKFSKTGSFTYPQAYANSSVGLYKKMLKLSKIGFVPIEVHRDVPMDAKMKLCTVKHLADGTWYAVLVYEDEKMVPKTQTTFISPVGIDLGLKSVISTTDGMKVEPLKALRRAERRLKHLQRLLSHKKKGSSNRAKARLRVAKQHSKIARQRRDFNHKLSTNLVRAHDLVIFEDLQVKNMVKNHAFAKSIQDAGWSQLVTFVDYKELKMGGLMLKVPAPFTTQDCSFCGTRSKVSLDMREFTCVGCGKLLDRDYNSARNVLKEGLRKVGQGMPNLKPVEMAPLPAQTTERAYTIIEAGTYPSSEPHANH